MPMAFVRRVALAIPVLGLVVACGDGFAGPGESVLTGQFGAADLTVEFLATHAGVEFTQACGSYFVSAEAAELGIEGGFRARGRWHSGGGGFTTHTEGATLHGQLAMAGGVQTITITLVLDDAAATVDPLTVTLRRAEHYAGPSDVCPA